MFGLEKKNFALIFSFVFFSVFTIFFSLKYGGETLSFSDILSKSNNLLIFHLRLPRLLTDFAVGAGLSIVGLSFQTLTRNPLAEPYLFGISSAAALGYVLGFLIFGGVYSYLFSFLLSVGTIFFVLAFFPKDGESSVSAILIGVALGFFYSAIVSVISVFLSSRFVKNIFMWYLGDTSSLSLENSILFFAIIFILSLFVFLDSDRLSLYGIGDEFAQTTGVDVKNLLYRQYILGSLITSVIVANCGAIGFVGLVIPHLAKLVFGNYGKKLFFIVFFLGGNFLVVADTLVKTLSYPMEIPIGITTAIIGSPFLVFLMKRMSNDKH